MDLASAAGFFDSVRCVDTFAPHREFLAQLDLFDDSRRDGTTVARRVLSVKPDVQMPSRRVITIDGEQWIVGTFENDIFDGDVVRRKYIIHRADGACTVQSAAQLITTGGLTTYAARAWIKDMKELDVSSRFEGFYNVYLPQNVAVTTGDMLTLLGEFYRVRNTFPSTAGFIVAESDRLPADMAVNAIYRQGTYDPATDAFAALVDTAVTVLMMRWQDNFLLQTEAAEKYVAGDVHGVVSKAALPAPAKAGDLVIFGAKTWEVISVDDEGTSWGLHLRPRGAG